MSDKVFRVTHTDPACAQKICLQDYNDAFSKHQARQFSIHGKRSDSTANLNPGWEEFRNRVWGEASFADRIQVRIHLPQQREMTLRLPDIASNGEILYADIQTLMEMGSVEFWIPDHLCRPGGNPTNFFIYTVRNRREFKALIRDLDAAGPMHREAMGNIFGLMCMDEGFGGQDSGISVAETTPVLGGLSQALEKLRLTALEGESSGCPDDDVDYFDEDTGKAVCYEQEPEYETEFGHVFHSAAVALGASLGMGAASAASEGMYFSLKTAGEQAVHEAIEEAFRTVSE